MKRFGKRKVEVKKWKSKMKKKGRALYLECRNKAKKVIANAMDEEARKKIQKIELLRM